MKNLSFCYIYLVVTSGITGFRGDEHLFRKWKYCQKLLRNYLKIYMDANVLSTQVNCVKNTL